MIVKDELKEKLTNKIISICQNEIKKGMHKELLGLTVNYFYDGEVIDIGCLIHIFNVKTDEGYTINISFILDQSENKSELIDIIKVYSKDRIYEIIKKISEEIKDYLKIVNWKSIVNTCEDMFIELKLYD